jgi:hypothetical protein
MASRYEIIIDFEAITVNVGKGCTIVPLEGSACALDHRDNSVCVIWRSIFNYNVYEVGKTFPEARQLWATFNHVKGLLGFPPILTGKEEVDSGLERLTATLHRLWKFGGYRLWAKGPALESYILDRRANYPRAFKLKSIPQGKILDLASIGCNKFETLYPVLKRSVHKRFGMMQMHLCNHAYGKHPPVLGRMHCALVETMTFVIWLARKNETPNALR